MKSGIMFSGSMVLFAAVGSLSAADKVAAVRDGKQLVIRSGDREVLRYQAEPGELPGPEVSELYRRGGYIRSLHTPGGRLVTDDFPPQHLHHHGIWSPWTKTEFEGRKPDFWNMGQGTGRVDFVAIDEVWEKDGRAGFRARHRFIDMIAMPEKEVLEEIWEVSVAAVDDRFVVDFSIKQTCAGDSPLKLPEYHYGGFGFRGNRAWDGAANWRLLTASGETDRLKVNTAREPWCWVGGEVDGALCGVVILCHPDNFRTPQPIRAHPTEPFFCYAPQQAGAMEIVPGKPYEARYRVIVSDGGPDAEQIAGWAAEYADLD